MSNGHTPGPWVECVDDQHPDEFSIEQDRDSLPEGEEPCGGIATVYLTGEALDREIGTANARLIASAPALLAALEAIVRDARTVEADGSPVEPEGETAVQRVPSDLIDAARSALSLARGER